MKERIRLPRKLDPKTRDQTVIDIKRALDGLTKFIAGECEQLLLSTSLMDIRSRKRRIHELRKEENRVRNWLDAQRQLNLW